MGIMKNILSILIPDSSDNKAEVYKSVSPEGIMSLLKESPHNSEYLLLDVRNGDGSTKIPGSVEIPLHEIEKNYGRLDFNKTIIVYCRSGVRSREASKKLYNLGAKNLINMDGGILAWEKAGGEVQKR
jgi:rhodanese-related sulfurtransferase